MEDRSALFNQLKNFSQRKLKKVETKVVTASGEQLVEKRGAKGLQVLSGSDGDGKNQDSDQPPRKLDLQVGLILPGLLLASQDVAHDKSSLDSYGITHILNLDSGVDNKFEDDYNYKNISVKDSPDFDLNNVFEDCFDYMDDGRHYGNVLIHCSGTIGLSRSTSICIAYLMSKEKQKFDEAFNNVKEARSFVKPNEGFLKQLKEYEIKLRGAQQIKDSGIDDPFALRKKQEIEQEKAMVAGAASVKNRMKMFGATLDTNAASRSKSVSPSPNANSTPSPAISKWAANNSNSSSNNNNNSSSSSSGTNNYKQDSSISKSMTPEPRKSWQTSSSSSTTTTTTATSKPGGPPPPPPPMPQAGELLKGSSGNNKYSPSPSSTPNNKFNESQETTNSSNSSRQRTVFGKVPPPPMKIKGGLSIERHDSIGDKNMGLTTKPSSHSNTQFEPQMESPAMFNQRSPLILYNNVPPKFGGTSSRPQSPQVQQGYDQKQGSGRFHHHHHQQQQQMTSPMARYLNDDHDHDHDDDGGNQMKETLTVGRLDRNVVDSFQNQLPQRTVSLGPRRPPPVRPKIGEGLKKNPWLQEGGGTTTTATGPPAPIKIKDRETNFNRMAKDLQSSLTELNNLIEQSVTPATPKISSNKPPKFTSYITNTSECSITPMVKPSFAKQYDQPPLSGGGGGSGLPEDEDEQEQRLTTWQIDSMNWKSSNSVNDLKSMFDKPKLATMNFSNTSPRLPPSSSVATTSPNILKNSPWQSLAVPKGSRQQQQQQQQQHQASNSSSSENRLEADYTIRRTTSTSPGGRGASTNVRNPYRSHYGNY